MGGSPLHWAVRNSILLPKIPCPSSPKINGYPLSEVVRLGLGRGWGRASDSR